MPYQAQLAAEFAAAPAVQSPLDFLTPIGSFLKYLEASYTDTPEKREAILATIMKVYDVIATDMGRQNMLLGAIFGSARPLVEGLVKSALDAMAPAVVVPAPAPVAHPPIGAAP